MDATITDSVPFRFDLDLSANALTLQERLKAMEADQMALQAQHSTELAEARADSEAKGRASSEAAAAKQMAEEVARLSGRAAELLAMRDSLGEQLEREACDLAYTIGCHLAETALAKTPFAEVEALLKDALAALSDTPHLILYLPEQIAEAIAPQVTGFLDEKGFSGRLIIKTDPDWTLADLRLEWSEGHLVRDRSEAEAALRETITNYFEAL